MSIEDQVAVEVELNEEQLRHESRPLPVTSVVSQPRKRYGRIFAQLFADNIKLLDHKTGNRKSFNENTLQDFIKGRYAHCPQVECSRRGPDYSFKSGTKVLATCEVKGPYVGEFISGDGWVKPVTADVIKQYREVLNGRGLTRPPSHFMALLVCGKPLDVKGRFTSFIKPRLLQRPLPHIKFGRTAFETVPIGDNGELLTVIVFGVSRA